MYYSSIGILALLIHIIINYDVLINSTHTDSIPAHVSYRNFLFGVMGYYVTDILWGALYALRLVVLAYTDTEIYFAVMALSVFFWTRYVITYLNEKSRYSVLLKYVGLLFIIFEFVVLTVNFFYPIVFSFDDMGGYHTGNARSLTLFIQLLLFLATAAHMLLVAARTRGKARRRHLTIGLFGLAMTIFVTLQALYPLMPFYAIGYMLGTCLLHTFVLEDEKETRREELENLLRIKQMQEKELGSARKMAYTDPLTGVKNKNAYMEDINGIGYRIEDGAVADFGVVVFDVNDLKIINDTKGHDEGDKYIQAASDIICRQFRHSPIYRIGGDEFVALLFGEDYENREFLLQNFMYLMEKNLAAGKVVISCGYEEFLAERDKSFLEVFYRADMKMYEQKRKLKIKPC